MGDQSHGGQKRRAEALGREHRTGVKTLVFTDMVDSTALKHKLGDRAAAEFFRKHHEIIRSTLRQLPDGEEIETAGDSFLLCFPTPSKAVQFALSALAQLRSVHAGSGLDRIGIHLGEVMVEQPSESQKPKDLFGIQIDTCARVMSLAQAGQVLMTRAVFDSARQVLKGEDIAGIGPLEWLNHGSYLLKGLEEPVEICEVRQSCQAGSGPPIDSEKAQRQVRTGEEPVLGWRPAVGQIIPNTRWVLGQKLGEGGFGEVWLARNSTTKQPRVFKFCFQAERVRFLKRELTLFRVLKERAADHPKIVAIHDVSLDTPPFYVEMEYLEGGDLRHWCQEHGGVAAIPMATRLEILAQAAEALQSAHDTGIIHRDIKPGNILISAKGVGAEEVRVKVADFGVGQLLSQESLQGITRAGFTETTAGSSASSGTGTHLYMAPELIAGRPASIRSDIYSLGVLLFQLVAGDLSLPVTTDWQKRVSDPLLREDLQLCFAGEPEERFGGAIQLARHLRELPERRSELARQNARIAAETKAAYRKGVIRAAGIGIGVAALLLGLTFWAVWQSRRAAAGELKARRASYAAGVLLAARELDANLRGRAFQLLTNQIPKAGEPDLRDWEWRHLWTRCQGGERLKLFARDNEITAVKFLPNGLLLTADFASRTNREVQLWDPASQQLLAACPISSSASSMAVSPDGNMVAVATWGRLVDLFKTPELRPLGILTNSDSVFSVAFSPDGKLLTCTAPSGSQIWDPAARTRRALGPGAATAAFSPDGKTLALGTVGGRVLLWDVAAEGVMAAIEGLNANAALAFSPDGRLLAAGSWQGSLSLANVAERQVTFTTNQVVAVRSVAFSRDSQTLASAGHDQLIHCWDLTPGQAATVVGAHLGLIASVDFSPDDHSLASGSKDGTVRIWDVHPAPRQDVVGDPFGVTGGLAISRNGKYLVRPGTNEAVQLWDIESRRETARLPVEEPFGFYAASSDGRFAATSLSNGWVTVWDIPKAQLVTQRRHSNVVNAIEFSADGKLCASAGDKPTIHVWDTETHQTRAVFNDPRDNGVRDLVFSRSGRLLASSAWSGGRVWDLSSPTPIHAFAYNDGVGTLIAFSPDEELLAASNNDSTTVVWSTRTWRPVMTLGSGMGGGGVGIAFSPDGRRLAIGGSDGRVELWDVASELQVATLDLHHASVGLVRFTPNGNDLLTGARSDQGTTGLVISHAAPWEAIRLAR